MRHLIPIVLASSIAIVSAQTPSPAFDVVSIKKSDPEVRGGGSRTMADGTTVITNQPIRVIFGRAAAEPVRDIENVPDWARDFYDITVKPPAGTDRTALPAMWKAMLADRLKLNAHVEHREKDGYALVLARSDGKLGPNLKPSDLDCTPRVQTSSPQPPPSPPTTFPAREDSAKRCGMQAGRDYIVSGGMTMERLAQLASGWVGGVPVNDRTGLQGFYSVEMNFPADNTRAAGTAADPAGSDELTALREQLGLKLEREKITIPVLVIDHIERPSEN